MADDILALRRAGQDATAQIAHLEQLQHSFRARLEALLRVYDSSALGILDAIMFDCAGHEEEAYLDFWHSLQPQVVDRLPPDINGHPRLVTEPVHPPPSRHSHARGQGWRARYAQAVQGSESQGAAAANAVRVISAPGSCGEALPAPLDVSGANPAVGDAARPASSSRKRPLGFSSGSAPPVAVDPQLTDGGAVCTAEELGGN